MPNSELKDTLVVAGFPGVGKSFLAKNAKKIKVVDLESSNYSKEPVFPQNYIEAVQKAMGTTDVVLISTHAAVRAALKQQEIPYVLVYPSIHQKQEYLRRYKERKNSKKFVDLMNNNWDDWIMECVEEDYPFKVELPTFFSCKYLDEDTIDLINIMK